MNTIIWFTIIFLTCTSISFSQSMLVYQTGTSIVVEAGAEICADTVIINGTFSGTGTICVPEIFEPIHPYLSTPANDYLNLVPVVIIRYLPTTDGINLNSNVTGIISTLSDMKNKIDMMDKQVKFSLEEGSKYRGYSNSNARPSLGYKVVYYVTVYENIPRSNFQVSWNPDIYIPDYMAILQRFNAQYYVEQLGVREFWIWGYHHGDIAPDESNMSSALTGDISNSHRFDDLPIYNQTYVLYNYNYGRGQNEAVHNHGHQLEAILSYINQRQTSNTQLFWDNFVGIQNGMHITGRCGWTHMPPNTTAHYDYENYTLVQSDIEDWTPARTGQLKYVNANTWGNINYGWPIQSETNIQSHWYIYWFQNMPGFGNTIQYSGLYYMTNWWEFTANWDTCITSNLGLYGLPKTLQLKCLIEGFYNQITDLTVKDTVRVYLRNLLSPYNIADSAKGSLDSLGKDSLIFWNILSGTSYYLVVKHRNSIETWSASAQSFTNNVLNYDFSTALTQAYGNNLVLKGAKYCIYSGDVNLDGNVDLDDVLPIYNDATNFIPGYVNTDVNGDMITDLNDVLIAFNNGNNFVSVKRP